LRQNFLHTEAEQMRQARKKMTITEFEPLTIIGIGGHSVKSEYAVKLARETSLLLKK